MGPRNRSGMIAKRDMRIEILNVLRNPRMSRIFPATVLPARLPAASEIEKIPYVFPFSLEKLSIDIIFPNIKVDLEHTWRRTTAPRYEIYAGYVVNRVAESAESRPKTNR